jgi:L-glyceraldehyde 3-phosphate reductase
MLCKRVWLTSEDINANIGEVRKLTATANQRGQKLSQMALAWVLRQPAVTSALIGASTAARLEEDLGAEYSRFHQSGTGFD